MLNNLKKLTKIVTKKTECNRLGFTSVWVWAVLKFLVSIKNNRQYKKLPWDNFVKIKKDFAKLFVVCKIFNN